MDPIKTCTLALGLALAGLGACDRKTEGPASVYAADKPDLGVANTGEPDMANRTDPASPSRPNPDASDSSTGYSDRTNAALRP
jgi:hypothetical protein